MDQKTELEYFSELSPFFHEVCKEIVRHSPNRKDSWKDCDEAISYEKTELAEVHEGDEPIYRQINLSMEEYLDKLLDDSHGNYKKLAPGGESTDESDAELVDIAALAALRWTRCKDEI